MVGRVVDGPLILAVLKLLYFTLPRREDGEVLPEGSARAFGPANIPDPFWKRSSWLGLVACMCAYYLYAYPQWVQKL